MEKGLEILAEIKQTHAVPVISDAHEPHQAKPAAEIIGVLQLPAFLCRQTDLVVARRNRASDQRQESSISRSP